MNKKLSVLALSLMGAMALSGCSVIPESGSKKSSSSSNDYSSTSGSSSIPTPVGNWSEEVQASMMEYLGEVLPYAPFDEETTTTYYFDLSELLGYSVFQVLDETEVNAFENIDYGALLVNSGYQKKLDTESSTYYYTKEVSEDISFEVDFGWAPADDEYTAGNVINVYIYDEGASSVPEEDEDLMPIMESVINALTGITPVYGEDYFYFYGTFYAAFELGSETLEGFINDAVNTVTDKTSLVALSEVQAWDEGYEVYFGTGLDDDIVVNVYDWEDEEGKGFEIDVYHGEAGGDDDDIPAADQDLIPYMEKIVETLFDATPELDENYFYDSSYRSLYTSYVSDKADIINAIDELTTVFVDTLHFVVTEEAATVDYNGVDVRDIYFGTGLDDDIVINAYSWVDQESNDISVAIDIYHGNGGGTDVDIPEEDQDLIPYASELASLLLNIEDPALGEDYSYDADYATFFFTFASNAETLEAAISEVATLITTETDLVALTAVKSFQFTDGTTGYEIYLGTGLEDDIVINVYDWEEDNQIAVEVDIYHGEIDDSTGGEGTGEVDVDDEGNYVAKLNFTTMSDGAVFTSQTVGEATFSCTTGANNDPTYYANGETLRVYYGSTFTFSVPEGYEIVSIKLDISVDPSNDKIKDFSVLDWNNGTPAVNETTCVVTPTDGTQDVSFNVTGTKGHIRFTSIQVTYRPVSE